MTPRFVPPPEIAALIDRIAALAAADDVEAYVVGGSVRDVLLGRGMHDLDIAVDRDALAFARRVAEALRGHFVKLDDVNAVARVVLDDGAVRSIDVAQLQGTLAEDLHRRDFTIDALAVPLAGGNVLDETGGIDDLARGVVRMTGAHVFDADPLRLLRGARLAAELGFELDAETERTIRARGSEIATAAPERQRDELARMLALDTAYEALRLLDRLGLLSVLLPDLDAGRGVEQPGAFHAYDVFEHGMHCVEAMDVMLGSGREHGRPEGRPYINGDRPWLHDDVWAAFAWCEPELRAYLDAETSEGRPRRALLKIAALLHDVAKPQTLSVDDSGRAHFFGHADLGAEIAGRALRRLRFARREVQFVVTLVAEHLRPVQLAAVGEVPTRRAIYRFYRDLGDAAPAVLLLSLADAASARGPEMTREGWIQHVGYMNSLLVRSKEEEGIVSPPRILTGRDIISELNVTEGPEIGRLLELLREAQAAGEVTDRADALAFVAEAARAQRPEGRGDA
jgi:tRNA nucleotidyltransferase/poly(A) polymerase